MEMIGDKFGFLLKVIVGIIAFVIGSAILISIFEAIFTPPPPPPPTFLEELLDGIGIGAEIFDFFDGL